MYDIDRRVWQSDIYEGKHRVALPRRDSNNEAGKRYRFWRHA